MGEFSCCSFVAGIIRGIVTASGIPCTVTAYDLKDDDQHNYVMYLIRVEM